MGLSEGRFITVEGGEGVGKTTFGSALKARIESMGPSVVQTREPGGTAVAQMIRGIFMSPPEDEPLSAKTELFLVSAARCQHLHQLIEPSLAKGSWVLCDRFHDSTRVYQGLGGGIDQNSLEAMISLSVGSRDPDLSFLLDCDVALSLQRVTQREAQQEEGNRYDQADVRFHQTLREGFLEVAERFSHRFVVLDASQDLDLLLERAVDEIQQRFGLCP